MSEPLPQPLPPARPGVLPWLVGAFALWQVAFPVLANLSEFVPRRATPEDHFPELSATQRWGRFTGSDALQTASERAGDLLCAWGELTGLDQGWNMFTPDFPPHTVVPVAELHRADGTVTRAWSRFAPRDPDAPGARWPLVHDREFNFEANITMLGWHYEPGADPAAWAQFPNRVSDNRELVRAWLKWKARGAADAREVRLVFRYVPTPLPHDPPGAPRRANYELPVAKWFPASGALEAFDPVAAQWVPLKVVSP
jgi:hypothetical protein